MQPQLKVRTNSGWKRTVTGISNLFWCVVGMTPEGAARIA
jgi:hypothetical protein